MGEEVGDRVSSDNLSTSNDASQSRQRKKRKWDQPAESLVSPGIVVPVIAPLGSDGSIMGMPFSGVTSVSGAILANPHVGSCATVPAFLQPPLLPQSTSTTISTLNQPKIQDELVIAREIVINDAESAVRYKLTKRQVQEEIQRSTGAVVITRGKYRPPNAPADGEKPLYLHVSAGAHLKDTAERILAVDHAAAMIEEMMKTGQKAQTTCVFLGFDADPSLNVTSRIRGPNDQYINHIMNETGATVALRGQGSGNYENVNGGEEPQPLHLFLSATNSKSLEDAKHLAENLLDTISLEFGATRFSSSKVYGAVPPPQKLMAGVQSSTNDHRVNTSPATCLPLPVVISTPFMAPGISVPLPAVSAASPPAMVPQYGGIVNSGQPQPNVVGYSPSKSTGGTSYIGYGGIYPQATPLQQVALALKQSVSPVTSTVPAATSSETNEPKLSTSSSSQRERQHTQRRKFQELPVISNGPAKSLQELELLQPDKRLSMKPAPPPFNGMSSTPPQTTPAPPLPLQNMPSPLPPPKFSESKAIVPPLQNMPPPRFSESKAIAPPPKFPESKAIGQPGDKNVLKVESDKVPDTLIKLMEYGDEDDDDGDATVEESFGGDGDATVEESFGGKSAARKVQKPFWAV